MQERAVLVPQIAQQESLVTLGCVDRVRYYQWGFHQVPCLDKLLAAGPRRKGNNPTGVLLGTGKSCVLIPHRVVQMVEPVHRHILRSFDKLHGHTLSSLMV